MRFLFSYILTVIGLVSKSSLTKETSTAVSHLVTIVLPNTMPLITTKKRDTAANANDKT